MLGDFSDKTLAPVGSVKQDNHHRGPVPELRNTNLTGSAQTISSLVFEFSTAVRTKMRRSFLQRHQTQSAVSQRFVKGGPTFSAYQTGVGEELRKTLLLFSPRVGNPRLPKLPCTPAVDLAPGSARCGVGGGKAVGRLAFSMFR